MTRQRRREQLRARRDQLRTRAKVHAQQVTLAARCRHPARHRVHQPRIGARILEDALLAIAHPHRALRQRMQLHKERELDRARILELVDDRQLQALGQHLRHAIVLHQRERAVQHVDVVDHPTPLLPRLVRGQAHARRVVDGERQLAQLGMQTRMRLVARRHLAHLHEKRIGTRPPLATFMTRELRPVAPVDLAVTLTTRHARHQRDRFLRGADAIIRLRQRLRCDRDLVRQGVVEGVAVALRLREELQQALGGALRHRRERRRRDAIAAREVHDVGDRAQPLVTLRDRLETQLEAMREAIQRRVRVPRQRRLQRLTQQLACIA